jgi:hypothetical protein
MSRLEFQIQCSFKSLAQFNKEIIARGFGVRARTWLNQKY